ncbi:MAG: hypothetical protein OEY55_12975 [Acidimicrobiia bacterium]|nr:hypothetical protein [Acidimicrobiia bacterium]MDH5504393.1 hypothetical protein [Acidimicrobiia bacterium]
MNRDSPPDLPGARETDQESDAASGQETISLLLQQTRPWVLVIAVLAAIGAGLMILGGIVFGVFVAAAPEMAGFDELPASFGVWLAGLYVFFGGLYVLPSMWLFKYSSRISRYIEAPTSATLGEALSAQKSFWKFTGIAALSLIALYFVLMIAFFLAVSMGI